MAVVRVWVALSIIAAMGCICWRMVATPIEETQRYVIQVEPQFTQPTYDTLDGGTV